MVKREDGTATILSVFCFSGNTLPEWMKEIE